MTKDPNKHVDPPKGGNDDGKDKNTVHISADDWKTMQNNMKHMNYTVKNLSKKLEIAHKSDNNSKSNKHVTNQSSNQNKNINPDIQNRLEKITKGYNDLKNQLQSENKHDNLVKYAKDSLKKNKMNVDSATFKRILGKDTDSIDQNIDWYKPIYQKLNASQTKFPKGSHHHKSKVNIGTELGKTLANGGVREKWTTNK